MSIASRLRNGVARMFFPLNRPERIEAGNPAGRRLASVPSTAVAINSLIRVYGRTVIGRSRYLCTNNPYATAAKETFVSSLVGSGIKPSSLMVDKEAKKVLQELWLDWTDEADHDGTTDFYGLQALAAAELFEAGECFIRIMRTEDNLTVPFRLQLIPSEMLPYDGQVTSKAAGTNRIDLGVEFDAKGKRVAYHFLVEHPTNGGVYVRTERVPAEEVLHLYRPIRAGQIRGLPQSVSSMARMAMLDLYDDAELERKRTTANFAAFIVKQASDEDDDGGPLGFGSASGSSSPNEVAMEPGAMIDLAPGEDVRFSEPADVGQTYDPFQYRTLLQIASGMGVPYATMTGDLMRANYGSIRAGEVQHRRRMTAYQHHVMVFQFCRPVWRLFTRLATLEELSPWTPSDFVANERELTRVKWIPPKWDWVDPLKDRQAEALAVAMGFKSRDDVIEEEGYDPEEMDERIAASQQRARDLKLVLGEGNTNNSAADPQADPSADEADPNADPDADPAEDQSDGRNSEQREADAAMIRSMVERYGVAVRGGVVTPQEEDETFFRSLIGVPEAGPLVREAWAKEKVRRPVTLSESPLAEKPETPQGEAFPGAPQPAPEPAPEDDNIEEDDPQ